MPTIDEAFEKISSLASDFHRHRAAYLAPTYSEAQARQDFVDKFLTALGWDVAHNHQRNPFEQEVRVERNVDVGHVQKRADYALFIAPNFRDPRVFVEAKRPGVTLATKDNYFQVIRYGWNSGHALGFITDFEGTHVLDCRYKPDIDKALSRSILTFDYKDYQDKEKFARLFYLLGRDAVADGALDKFAASLVKKGRGPSRSRLLRAGVQSIDASFLEELDGHRETLAKSLKSHNQELDGESLTEVTQRILDRLVFLRFLEDKLIETSEAVTKFGRREGVWKDFVAASRRLDTRYNGVVFKRHAIIDSDDLDVDESTFAGICESLSHERSPYNFDLIPIHILGSIYERFLGKVIVTTEKRAKVEEKPEVRKAGGVYYTPAFIVRYIVERTVGQHIAGKTPAQIAGMRFADIACGSGSFLLGVFDLLLQYHRDWYNANPKKIKKGDCWRDEDGHYRLTLAKRREILLNNIYGVDIDPQAVEVAQLSLYLKLLEEETTATARGYQLEMHSALLPGLGNNIVCGNSIIEPSMIPSDMFDDELERKVNAMSFEAKFPTIMRDGGFDVIVGNPPYVNAWGLYENQPEIRELLNSIDAYSTADRHWDLYVLFLERAIQKVKAGGRVGYIIPYSFAIQKYGQLARKHVLSDCTLESVADLRSVQVFEDVPVITIVPVVRKDPPAAGAKTEVLGPVVDDQGSVTAIQHRHNIKQSVWREQHEFMLRLDLNPTSLSFVERVKERSIPFGNLCYVNYGAQLSSREKGKFGKEEVIDDKKVSAAHRPLISGRELYRYDIRWQGRYVDYARSSEMYGPRWAEFFEQPKIMVRDITGTHRIESTLDEEKFYCDHTLLCAQRKCDLREWREFPRNEVELSETYELGFLAAVVASRVVSAYYYLVLTGEGVRTGGAFHTYPETIRQFPVPRLDAKRKADREFQRQLAGLAKKAIECKRKAAEAKTDRHRDHYKSRFEHIDREIDECLFRFYGLNDEAVAMVMEVTGA